MELHGEWMHRSVGQAIGSVTLAGVCLTLACGRRPQAAYKDLPDDDPQVRADTAVRLGQARAKDAVDSLVTLLDDPDDRVRFSAILALGEIGDPRAVPALIAHASDPRTRIRTALCRSLGQLSDARAIPLLIRLLEDMEYPVRLAAARALASIPGRESTEALVQVVLRDESDSILAEVTKLLHGMDTDLALEMLQGSVKTGEEEARANAARVIGQMGDRQCLPVLLEALDDPFYRVRCLAAHALVELAPDDARVKIALKQRMAAETHELAQVDLAWSLARVGDPSHVDQIRSLLVDGAPEQVRAEAAMALGDVGDESDVPRLEKALRADDMGVVRREAYVAIQKLKRG